MGVTTFYRDFATHLAATEGITLTKARQLTQYFVTQIHDRLCRGERIKFGKYFHLFPAAIAERNLYIPATGERVRYPAHRTLRVSLCPEFRDEFGAGTEVSGKCRPAPSTARKPSKDSTPKKKVSQAKRAKKS
jgi:nucleoid DNA-binding protein